MKRGIFVLHVNNAKKDLCSIELDKVWPVLSPLHLSYLELKRDKYFPFIPTVQINQYITSAMELGTTKAKDYQGKDFISIINEILKAKLRIRFLEHHPTNPSIRAQYDRKQRTIKIYRSSLKQIKQFLLPSFGEIHEIDLMKLHLLHEWYHFLEERSFGQTDRHFPPVIIKKRGPFIIKRTVYQLREIAAHSFTQTALNLSWSPLLLDQYRLLLEKGYSHSQIRESFQATGMEYYAIINN